jgi:hypothetical protein
MFVMIFVIGLLIGVLGAALSVSATSGKRSLPTSVPGSNECR